MSDSDIQRYIDQLPEDRRAAILQLAKAIDEHIDPQFSKEFSYGMIGWVVPHTLYPAGYHANPKLSVPFMNLGNQKNYIVLHHLGLYGSPELLHWFEEAYAKTGNKLDMGKGCVRFKNMDKIPYELIGQLAGKVSLQDYLVVYQKNFKR
jgi:uncharacterized protein YdhG (YjbR/CyaY superfamily)